MIFQGKSRAVFSQVGCSSNPTLSSVKLAAMNAMVIATAEPSAPPSDPIAGTAQSTNAARPAAGNTSLCSDSRASLSGGSGGIAESLPGEPRLLRERSTPPTVGVRQTGYFFAFTASLIATSLSTWPLAP